MAKRPLTGAALESTQQAEAERRAAVEARADVAATARGLALLAARVSGLPGPDALRSLFSAAGADGAECALRVIRAAGLSPDVQARQWAGQRQSSTVAGDIYANDPSHDPRVTAAIVEGQDGRAVNALIAQIAEERQAEKEQAAAANRPGVLWVTREGEELREGGPATPLRRQASVEHQTVAPLGSEGS